MPLLQGLPVEEREGLQPVVEVEELIILLEFQVDQEEEVEMMKLLLVELQVQEILRQYHPHKEIQEEQELIQLLLT